VFRSVPVARKIQPLVKAIDQTRHQVNQSLASKDPLSQTRLLILDYYAVLTELQQRFEFGDDRRSVGLTLRRDKRTNITIPFCYNESVQSGAPGSRASRITSTKIEFEKCAMIFNYGARLSREGVDAKGVPDTGLTRACQLFREASGVFAYLSTCPDAKSVNNLTPDFSVAVTSWISNLMLAQAQTCVFEKAAASANPPASPESESPDKPKTPVVGPESVAALASGCASLYTKVCNAVASQPALKAALSAAAFPWDAHAQFQRCCFTGAAHFWYAKALAAKHDYGGEIAHLRAAKQFTQSASHFDESVRKSNEALVARKNNFIEVIQQRLSAAERDNDTIYFAQIPSTISPVEPKVLVSPIAFDPKAGLEAALAAEPQQRTLLPRLVELKTLVSASVHSASQDFARKLSAAVDDAVIVADSAIAKIRTELNSLGLPSSLDAVLSMAKAAEAARLAGKGSNGELAGVQFAGIPADMKAQLATYKQNGGIAGLRSYFNSIQSTAVEADSRINALSSALERESAELPAMEAQFGNRWIKPEDQVELKSLRTDLDSITNLLATAAKSNQVVADELTRFSASENAKLLELSEAELDKRFSEIQRAEQQERANAREEARRKQRAELASSEEDANLDIYEILAKRPATVSLKASLDALALYVDQRTTLVQQAREVAEKAKDQCPQALAKCDNEASYGSTLSELEAPVQQILSQLKDNSKAEQLLTDVREKNVAFAAEVKTATSDPSLSSTESKTTQSENFLKSINDALEAQGKLFANLQEGYNFYSQLLEGGIEPLSNKINAHIARRESLRAALIDELQRTLAAFTAPSQGQQQSPSARAGAATSTPSSTATPTASGPQQQPPQNGAAPQGYSQPASYPAAQILQSPFPPQAPAPTPGGYPPQTNAPMGYSPHPPPGFTPNADAYYSPAAQGYAPPPPNFMPPPTGQGYPGYPGYPPRR